jgi:hypothetical protein
MASCSPDLVETFRTRAVTIREFVSLRFPKLRSIDSPGQASLYPEPTACWKTES